MTINQNLISASDSFNFTTDFKVNINSVQVLLAQFHYEHGPEMLDCGEDSLKMAECLFPAKWDDNITFMTRFGSKYIYGIGVISNKIKTPRGALQVSIALCADRPCFSNKHRDFLVDTAAKIRNLDEIKFESVKNSAEEKNILINESKSIFRPLDMFDNSNTICSLFEFTPNDLLTLWKARMLQKKFALTYTDNIGKASYVCYFFSVCCLPFRKPEESSFHIELPQTNNFETDPWSLCCVTHPLLQSNDKIPISFGKGETVKLDAENKWLETGEGEIIDEITAALGTNNDRNVLNVLITETQRVINLTEFRNIDQQSIESAKLDVKSIRFIREVADMLNHHPKFDVSDFKCC